MAQTKPGCKVIYKVRNITRAIDGQHRQVQLDGLTPDFSVPQLIASQSQSERLAVVAVSPIRSGSRSVGESTPQCPIPKLRRWQEESCLTWPRQQRSNLAGQSSEIIDQDRTLSGHREQVIDNEPERRPRPLACGVARAAGAR
ncbi:hypothetical protein [Micromonospora sp. NPDC023814]|uniref:hypothetical protein n=1 Tax=Micromonospora sp. NPDC023814 TaxID=3154596 RepID=UPI003410951C